MAIEGSGNYTLVPATDAAGFEGVPSSDLRHRRRCQANCNAADCFTPKLHGDKGTNSVADGLRCESATGSRCSRSTLGVNPLSSTGCSGYTPPGGRTGNDYYEFQLFQAEADKTVVMEYSKPR